MAKIQIKEKQSDSKTQTVLATDFSELQASSYPNGHAQKMYLLKDNPEALNVPVKCMFLYASQWTLNKIHKTPEATYMYFVTMEETAAYPKGTLLCERLQHPKYVADEIKLYAHKALLNVISAIHPPAIKAGVVVGAEVARVFTDSTMCGRTFEVMYVEKEGKQKGKEPAKVYRELKYTSVGELSSDVPEQNALISELIEASGFEFPAGHFDDQTAEKNETPF